MAKKKHKEVPPNEAGNVFVVAEDDGGRYWGGTRGWVECWTEAEQFRFGGPEDPYGYCRKVSRALMCAARLLCHPEYIASGTLPVKKMTPKKITVKVRRVDDGGKAAVAALQMLLDEHNKYHQQMMEGRCDVPEAAAS